VNGPAAVLEAYFRGKDGHRPDLARPAFAVDAELEVRNRSTAVAFPAITTGRDAIVDVLVAQFGRLYANVRSFYLDRPAEDATRLSCDWLVGMTARDDGSARIGCGRYDWTLRASPGWCAQRLVISIDVMESLPPALVPGLVAWLRALPYPWTTAAAVAASAPAVDALEPVLARLRVAR
jgi:hypothetical protein